jgi:hypothetical protein
MRYLLMIYNNEQEYDAMPEAEREADFNNHYAYAKNWPQQGICAVVDCWCICSK